MAGGGPSDHPLTDVINFNTDIYGVEADALLRQLDQLFFRANGWLAQDLFRYC